MNGALANAIRSALIALLAFFNSTLTLAAVSIFCLNFVSPIGPPDPWPSELWIPLVVIYFLSTLAGALLVGWVSRSASVWPALAATGPYLLLTFSQSNSRADVDPIDVAVVTFIVYYAAQRLFKTHEHRTI